MTTIACVTRPAAPRLVRGLLRRPQNEDVAEDRVNTQSRRRSGREVLHGDGSGRGAVDRVTEEDAPGC